MVFGAGGSNEVQGTGMFSAFKMYRTEDGSIAFGDKPKNSKDAAASDSSTETAE